MASRCGAASASARSHAVGGWSRAPLSGPLLVWDPSFKFLAKRLAACELGHLQHADVARVHLTTCVSFCHELYGYHPANA